jgi:cbb3-type cytochrome c oxidase subunit III
MVRASMLLVVVLATVGISAQGGSQAAPAVPPDVALWMRLAWGVDPNSLGYTDTHFLLSLTEGEREGAFLFKQRCNLCHYSMAASVQGAGQGILTTKSVGPLLTKGNVEGREDAVRKKIMEGSANMPAFQYGLTPAQVDMIIGYLKKVEGDTTTAFLKRVLKR